MKRNEIRTHKAYRLPVAWQAAEYAALQFNAADTCDDRVSDDIYDVDDERAEVEDIVHRMEREFG